MAEAGTGGIQLAEGGHDFNEGRLWFQGFLMTQEPRYQKTRVTKGGGRLQSADVGLGGCHADMCTDRLAVLPIPFEDHTGADGGECLGLRTIPKSLVYSQYIRAHTRTELKTFLGLGLHITELSLFPGHVTH